jgi:hypothetical protein
MTIQTLRAFFQQHSASMAGVAALGAALDARASGVALEPALANAVQTLLGALGAGDDFDDVRPEEAAGLLTMIRMMFAADAKLLRADTRTAAWDFTSPELLSGIGGVARGHAQEITREIVPALAGLADRLRSPGAAFLDVGVGVAGLAVAFAQMWPEVRIVGIDPWQPSLAIARRTVDDANLGDRIELREQGGEALADEAAFDLAWVAFPFIPERVMVRTLERTRQALRPGGWAVLGLSNHASAPPIPAAAMGLRVMMFGGPDWNAERTEAELRSLGYVDVHTLPIVPGSVLVNVVGRRPT